MDSFTLRILDINDNPPTFEWKVYNFSISENRNGSTEIDQVTANDPDKDENGTVRYSLVSGSEYFSIDEQSGMIISNRPFDREDIPSYVIMVNAEDQGTPPKHAPFMATVNIEIIDENDNSPVFSPGTQTEFELYTNQPVGTTIGRVRATDSDEGENAEINYVLEPFVSYFNISDMGEIILQEPLTFKVPDFNLTVIASNPGNSDRAARLGIIITVNSPSLSLNDIIIIGCVGGGVVLIIVVLLLFKLCCCCYRRKKGKYNLKDTKTHLNNHQTWKRKEAVIANTKVMRKLHKCNILLHVSLSYGKV